ncbi:SPOSA6832_01583, partial [Sporobolomyces salmonicolor]
MRTKSSSSSASSAALFSTSLVLPSSDSPIRYSRPLPQMEIAVILAAGLRDWIDFGVIIGILMLNAFVGWYQEKQAGDIVAQLKAGIAMKAIVVRGGQEHEIEARDLVPGDIIVVEEGATIPADAKILATYEDKDNKDLHGRLEKLEKAKKAKKQSGDDESDEDDGDDDELKKLKGASICSVDQSAITGESLAVDKFLGETAYYTCGVKRGKFIGIVTASAKQSFVGRTAALVMSSNDEGHFKQVLNGIGTALLILVVGFIFAMLIGGFFRNVQIARPKENNLLVYALIFLIIGVPVGLPCVTTTTMAVGAAYLARRKAIVQKLTAIESLAGVDILCSDKTGTLTANKLSLNEPYVADGVEADWFMAVAVLASSHNIKSLDPIDKITVTSLRDFPGAQEILKKGWKTHKFTPFDPVSKRITAEVECDGKQYTCAKGAPNAILRLTKFSPDVVSHYREKAQAFASRGFRSLGVAVKEEGKDWVLLGLISMSDPPRHDTPPTVREAQELGIGIKMLTGDAVAIAKETCRQLGMGDKVYDSERLLGGGMSGSEIRDFLEAADGFAEVFPEHKYQVVEMLMQRGHLIAMTGDGVNDAPALKKADCGIAVEGASDAARSAADIVFLDEGLSTIITSIKVARQIFHRMKAYIVYRIALCLHLEVYLLLSMLILNETIRVDLIVFLAIFADVATIAIAYDNAQSARRPVEWQLPKVWIISTILGLLLAAGTWIVRGTLFLGGQNGKGGIIQNYGSIQEVLFLEVALTESWLILITRIDTGAVTPRRCLRCRYPRYWFVMSPCPLPPTSFDLKTLHSFRCPRMAKWIGSAPRRLGRHCDAVPHLCLLRRRHHHYRLRLLGAQQNSVRPLSATSASPRADLLSLRSFLNNLGRKKRSDKNTVVEDFMQELKRMTLIHERSEDQSVFRFTTGTEEEAGSSASDKKQGDKKEADKSKEQKSSKNENQQKDAQGGKDQAKEAPEDLQEGKAKAEQQKEQPREESR